MGTISQKVIAKAFLILINTLFFGCLFYFLISNVKIFHWFKTNNISDFMFYALVFIIYISYCLINNTIINIVPKNKMLIYIVVPTLIFVLLSRILYIYFLFFLFFLFLYAFLLNFLSHQNIKKISYANIIVLSILLGIMVLLTLIIGSDVFDYYCLLAFIYLGIFHFILVLLNIKTFSKMEEENQLQ